MLRASLAKKKIHKYACHLRNIYLPVRLLHVATPKTIKEVLLISWWMFFLLKFVCPLQ